MNKIRGSNKDTLGLEWYEVFVAGMPATIDFETVLIFFSSIGPVQKLEVLKMGKKQRGNRLRKKFYMLTTFSPKLFELLVGAPGPEFRGRRLFCQEYKSGDDLASHSADINSRRIVIKQVPLSVNETDLKTALSQVGGILETLYEYKSDVDIKTEYSKSYKTCSATFKSGLKVSKLIEEGILHLPSGTPVLIERFLYKRRLAPDTLLDDLTQVETNLNRSIFEKQSAVQGATTNLNFEASNSKHSSGQCSKLAPKADKVKLNPYRTPDSDVLILNCITQSYKPTSVKYHQSANGPKSQPLRETHIHSIHNLRFNTLMSRL